MGEVTKIETYVAPTEKGFKDPSAETVAALSNQARTGVTRASSAVDAPTDRPAWLPENFKSPEALVKSYTEAQAEITKLRQGAAKPAEAKTPEPKADPTPVKAADLKTAEAVVAAAGFDMPALEAEYAQNGKLSDESMASLGKAGITPAHLDIYIAGREALHERNHNELHQIAGGKERFDEMREWGATNLSEAEKVALDKTLDSSDHEAIKLAFRGVFAKWSAAGHNEPTKQLRGMSGGQAVGDIYTHRDEILADMKTEAYKTNEAFRMQVLNKIKRSNVW